MLEHELKAVVADPADLRNRLLAAGARPGFAGLMQDRRYDRNGELLARDEVLRVRRFQGIDGREATRLGWKGPTGVSAGGYKVRRELEYEIAGSHSSPAELLDALRFQEIHRIDRYVEYYELGSASLRLEWYPRMDVLLEVEGDEQGIEPAVRATGIPRGEFSAESLTEFAARYAERTGSAAVLMHEAPSPDPAGWSAR